MQFIGDVERRENGDLERINRERARRNLAHPAIDKLGELRDILAVTVRADVVGLVVNLYSDGRCCCCVHIAPTQTDAVIAVSHLRTTSAISGSSAAIASSMASTFMRIVSRSERMRSS